jgi:hypothetical protein
MTAPASEHPEPTEPVSEERPRLLINGEPVRPEDLGRGLSAALQERLSAPAPAAASRRPRLLGSSPPRERSLPLWLLLLLAAGVMLGSLLWWWKG